MLAWRKARHKFMLIEGCHSPSSGGYDGPPPALPRPLLLFSLRMAPSLLFAPPPLLLSSRALWPHAEQCPAQRLLAEQAPILTPLGATGKRGREESELGEKARGQRGEEGRRRRKEKKRSHAGREEGGSMGGLRQPSHAGCGSPPMLPRPLSASCARCAKHGSGARGRGARGGRAAAEGIARHLAAACERLRQPSRPRAARRPLLPLPHRLRAESALSYAPRC